MSREGTVVGGGVGGGGGARSERRERGQAAEVASRIPRVRPGQKTHAARTPTWTAWSPFAGVAGRIKIREEEEEEEEIRV